MYAVCPDCQALFSSLEELVTHERLSHPWADEASIRLVGHHHSDSDLECSDCGVRFARWIDFQAHQLRPHYPIGTRLG